MVLLLRLRPMGRLGPKDLLLQLHLTDLTDRLILLRPMDH